MSWTNRMARRGSERSLHSLQSMHPGHSSSASSSQEATAMSTATNTNTGMAKVYSDAVGNAISTNLMSTSVSCDSRIPRLSTTGLHRSASMRMRGERVPAQSTPATAALLRSHQHQSPHNHDHLLHHYHQHPDHRIFPVITENGTDSPRQRSLSLSLTSVRPRAGFAASGGSSTGIADDSDAESVKSYGSACSAASACDHATFALNGTTWSGRSRKYVVHCSNHNGDNEQYLTPTQRAARQVRKFQSQIHDFIFMILDRKVFGKRNHLHTTTVTYHQTQNNPDL